MEEKVYRQRRNLMITCIGIIIFYMGNGELGSLGLLNSLGLSGLDPWKMKVTVVVFLLYFSIRYMQYSSEYPGPFIESLKNYLNGPLQLKANSLISPIFQELLLQNRSRHCESKVEGRFYNVSISSLFGPWFFEFQVEHTVYDDIDSTRREVEKNTHDVDSFEMETSEWFLFKLGVILKVAGFRTGFTDWVMPWIVFWFTSILITWNEFIADYFCLPHLL